MPAEYDRAEFMGFSGGGQQGRREGGTVGAAGRRAFPWLGQPGEKGGAQKW